MVGPENPWILLSTLKEENCAFRPEAHSQFKSQQTDTAHASSHQSCYPKASSAFLPTPLSLRILHFTIQSSRNPITESHPTQPAGKMQWNNSPPKKFENTVIYCNIISISLNSESSDMCIVSGKFCELFALLTFGFIWSQVILSWPCSKRCSYRATLRAADASARRHQLRDMWALRSSGSCMKGCHGIMARRCGAWTRVRGTFIVPYWLYVRSDEGWHVSRQGQKGCFYQCMGCRKRLDTTDLHCARLLVTGFEREASLTVLSLSIRWGVLFGWKRVFLRVMSHVS